MYCMKGSISGAPQGEERTGRRLTHLDHLFAGFHHLVKPHTLASMECVLAAVPTIGTTKARREHPPSWIESSDLLYATLYWAARYPSLNELEITCCLPHSEAVRAFQWVLTCLLEWTNANITLSPPPVRSTQLICAFPTMPTELHGVSVIADTTDIPRNKGPEWSTAKAKKFYSKKLKCAAWRLLVPLTAHTITLYHPPH